MNARNGKTLITQEKIDKVKTMVAKGSSIRDAANAARVVYSSAWRIVNGYVTKESSRHKMEEKKQSEFFEHDPYYSY
jgi:molybdenum-dependent DNA-binding transcriptional regulator ModE